MQNLVALRQKMSVISAVKIFAHAKVGQSLGNVFIGHIPNHAKFRCDPTKMSQISAVENLCSRKNWTNFTKIEGDLLRTNAPYHAEFHRSWSNDVREKRYNFCTPFIILASQGTPCTKVHQSGWWHIARPPLSSCQISSHSESPCTRYLLQNSSISLTVWPTHKKNKV